MIFQIFLGRRIATTTRRKNKLISRSLDGIKLESLLLYINSLYYEEGTEYEERAGEGDMNACTKEVTPYKIDMRGVTINFYDPPGLQDGTRDLQYLKLIKAKCPKLHLIIFCTNIGEPVRPSEREAIKALDKAFGAAILYLY